jgi:CBS domain-containing protein
MQTKLVTFAPDADVFTAIDRMMKNRISGAPVVDGEKKLLGVLSEESVIRVLMVADYEQLPSSQVDAFMDQEPTTIDENTQLISMAQMMVSQHRRRLQVVRDGVLVGQVSRRDVCAAAVEIARKTNTPERNLLYLSALRKMSDAPEV